MAKERLGQGSHDYAKKRKEHCPPFHSFKRSLDRESAIFKTGNKQAASDLEAQGQGRG
ncbi:MAG: hypothetical protein JRJ54_07180 [Deltaproteobacteria bacterium]|nr:hypothetical protein [Deltaproteobacteria bacterium]